jgi:hypothetical protein
LRRGAHGHEVLHRGLIQAPVSVTRGVPQARDAGVAFSQLASQRDSA